MRVHLVLYSNSEPYDTTKRLTIETVNKYTTKNLVIHDYTLEVIKPKEWFKLIQDLPLIHRVGRRDGYYNAYKAFCVNEVYNSMNSDDILYYVDSSKYFISGFTESIDKLCDIVNEKGFIAGSVGDDVRNCDDVRPLDGYGCCDHIGIWDKIIPNNDNRKYMADRHVLNSWFILKKNSKNTTFMDEWVKWVVYKDNDLPLPLITYNHTADQSIFNILIRKYNMHVFYCKNLRHDDNKDKNLSLNLINNSNNADDFFICL